MQRVKDLSQNCSSSPKCFRSFVNSQRGKSSPNSFRVANGSVFTDHVDIASFKVTSQLIRLTLSPLNVLVLVVIPHNLDYVIL